MLAIAGYGTPAEAMGAELGSSVPAVAYFCWCHLPIQSDACDALAGLSAEQRALALRSEAMWRRAREVASANPGVDVGDIFHALQCLELTPTERLRRGLARGRLRA